VATDLTGANFSGGDLAGAKLEKQRLVNAFFKETSLVGANLKGA
jgi:uncharacterized protein YjbI with pentapeptide repeats